MTAAAYGGKKKVKEARDREKKKKSQFSLKGKLRVFSSRAVFGREKN